jgi:peptidoglycan/xylan/chitin deacetylase (PgdA/CDA1 family)
MTLRSRFGPLAKSTLLRTGSYRALRNLAPSRRVAILRYHAICGEEGACYADPGICVPPAAFEEHVRYLASNYTVLPLTDVVERLRGRRELPRNTVAITFDDGYADNLAAARTLHRHGVSATFFITSGCLAGGEPFWPSEIRALVRRIPGPELTLSLDGRSLRMPLRGETNQLQAIRTLSKLFKSNRIPVRESLREQLRAAAGHPDLPNFMLQWDELVQMHRLGMTIGAHTVTHANLPSAGLEAATREIAGSKERLERELGAPVSLFSYPNGGAERYYTPELQQVVAQHFSAAATSRNAFAGPRSDLYALERIQVARRVEDLVFALEVERFAFKPRRRPSEVV